MATQVKTNGAHKTGEETLDLSKMPSPPVWEVELWDSFDAVRTKFEQLKGVRWASYTVQRAEDGRFKCRVTL